MINFRADNKKPAEAGSVCLLRYLLGASHIDSSVVIDQKSIDQHGQIEFPRSFENILGFIGTQRIVVGVAYKCASCSRQFAAIKSVSCNDALVVIQRDPSSGG